MSDLSMLLSRVSVAPAALGEPAPSDRDLDLILEAGLRAPDHGRLRPWCFVLIRGAAREALGDVLAQALRLRDPTATDALLERERAKALRAPLIIAIGAKLRPAHPVPEIEQLLSTGAAVMNLLNAVHALGYGGMWVTGASTYDPVVLQALGLHAPDRLVGFLHVGTPAARPQPVERPERPAHVRTWTGPVGDTTGTMDPADER